ncbi:MAG: hypothetical protein U0R77_11230 [Mycolicibacterium insubricum]|nr:hypothetical protein [Mycobacterium sp.]
MSQRVQNRLNAGLAALSATAVVAGPVLAAAPASAQAPEVLRSSAAVQLAASSGLLTSAERVGQAIVSSPVALGVIGYSVVFGDQQTLADQLGALADAPAWALSPALSDQPQATAALKSAAGGLKAAATAFATKTPIANDNPAAELIKGSGVLATATWNALAAGPKNLPVFLKHVGAGDNVGVYNDIKDALETPLTISKLVTAELVPAGTDSKGNPVPAVLRFGSLVTAVNNVNHGIESDLALALGVKIDKNYNGTGPAVAALKSPVAGAKESAVTGNARALAAEDTGTGSDTGVTGGTKTPTSLSQVLRQVDKSFVPSTSVLVRHAPAAKPGDHIGTKDTGTKDTGAGTGTGTGTGTTTKDTGTKDTGAKDTGTKDTGAKETGAKPSADHETGGKHRAPDSGDK